MVRQIEIKQHGKLKEARIKSAGQRHGGPQLRKAIYPHQRRAERDEPGCRWIKVIKHTRGIRAAALRLLTRCFNIQNFSSTTREQENPNVTERIACRRILKKLCLPIFVANLESLDSAGFRLLAQP